MAEHKKLMIVEDDALLSIVTEQMALSLGYAVVGKAKSGEEALRKASECNPEILLIDINLAGELDGVETAQAICELYMGIPVIFLSGDISHEIKRYASKVDYLDFLSKPVSTNQLGASLEKASQQEITLSQNAA